ncbi:MAG TPA: hypothetical protein VMU51_31565 [Mycobacteriales bacterium]|nr:hypothetical protein [Mycobacteriales bacterium]
MTGSLPPHWPPDVLPPASEEWAASAVSWLLDQVPGEYRAYEVLRRHPVLLSRFAVSYVEACLQAARQGWRSLRRDLGGELPPEVLETAMTAYEREGARLAELARSVAAVDAALHGRRWHPQI